MRILVEGLESVRIRADTEVKIIVQGLKNIDFVRKRTAENMFAVSFVGKDGYVITQGTISEEDLDDFVPKELQSV